MIRSHRASLCLVLALLLALIAGSASGQRREVCCPKYDTGNETTVYGVVEKVETRIGQAENPGIHLVVRGKDGLYDVHVGPKRYVQRLGVSFSEGDAVMVMGAPLIGAVRQDPETPLEVVARRIVRGDDTVDLRGEDGWPLWRRRDS